MALTNQHKLKTAIQRRLWRIERWINRKLPDSPEFIDHTQDWDHIGRGQCSTVYTLKDTNTVIKIPNSLTKEIELIEDLSQHERVLNVIAHQDPIHAINVPHLGQWVDKNNEQFWISNGDIFTDGHAPFPTYGLLSEHIHSVPADIINSLIKIGLPVLINHRKLFLKRREHKDYLICVYLGQRWAAMQSNAMAFNLRNFPLYVNETSALGRDFRPEPYVTRIASALAMMHWKAGIDANDVEFVLGRRRSRSDKSSARELRDNKMMFGHKDICLWILDFNQCKIFELSEEGIEQLVRGFWLNDPYYPKPNLYHPEDVRLWKLFVERYLQSS